MLCLCKDRTHVLGMSREKRRKEEENHTFQKKNEEMLKQKEQRMEDP